MTTTDLSELRAFEDSILCNPFNALLDPLVGFDDPNLEQLYRPSLLETKPSRDAPYNRVLPSNFPWPSYDDTSSPPSTDTSSPFYTDTSSPPYTDTSPPPPSNISSPYSPLNFELSPPLSVSSWGSSPISPTGPSSLYAGYSQGYMQPAYLVSDYNTSDPSSLVSSVPSAHCSTSSIDCFPSYYCQGMGVNLREITSQPFEMEVDGSDSDDSDVDCDDSADVSYLHLKFADDHLLEHRANPLPERSSSHATSSKRDRTAKCEPAARPRSVDKRAWASVTGSPPRSSKQTATKHQLAQYSQPRSEHDASDMEGGNDDDDDDYIPSTSQPTRRVKRPFKATVTPPSPEASSAVESTTHGLRPYEPIWSKKERLYVCGECGVAKAKRRSDLKRRHWALWCCPRHPMHRHQRAAGKFVCTMCKPAHAYMRNDEFKQHLKRAWKIEFCKKDWDLLVAYFQQKWANSGNALPVDHHLKKLLSIINVRPD